MNNKVEILKTKLFRPKLPLDFVPRPHLIEILEKHHGIPLCLLSAPAGYGKSTTLSSWLEQCGHKSAWLSLDEDDNNLVTINHAINPDASSIFIWGVRGRLAM